MRENQAANWQESITGRPEQIAAITSECRLTVVSAGAGTGKTHTLSQRFAWILAQHPDCAVDEILVLTFTEKAAREMQERIAGTVGNLYEAHKSELKHLKESVQRMGDAYISTIHSFAMKVIRESALSLDIDPTASIVPEPKEDLWWESYAYALDAMSIAPLEHLLDAEWKQRAEALFNSQQFADLVNNYRPDGLADAAKNACGTLGSAGYAPEDLWNWPEDRLLEKVASMEQWFDHVWDCWMEDILPHIEDELLASAAPFPQNLLAVYGRFREAPKTQENKTAFAQALVAEGLASLSGGKKTTKDYIAERLHASLKEWRDEAKTELRKAAPPSEEERALSLFLNRVAALGWHCWDSVRRGEGMLSMNDLIAYAGEAVKKEQAYAKKFKYILVDEFQDTDALQDDLISSLWNEENKLFLVGDLKQSIYRFRHADLRLFQKYIELAKNDPQHNCYISLDRSFRTKGELLYDFNKIFSDLWSEGLEPGSKMTYEALGGPDDAQWWEERNKPALQPVLEAMLAVKPNINKKKEEDPQEKEQNKESIATTRVRLFQKLAERFKYLKESGDQVWEKSGGEPGHRDIRWNDFALLVPTRTVYPAVEQAFESAGVPYVLCTSKNYFARGEVGDIANLVQLLNDPQNPLYLGGWIACPFSGVPAGTAEDLMRAASEKNGGVRGLAGTVRDALSETWREVERLRKTALLQGPSAAILELLKKPAYLAHYAPDARRSVMMNLSYLAGIAAEYERSEGVSLSGFADYLQMLTISQQQKEEPDVSDETQDAVQVLTVHASKGLEYPVVAVLCDEGGSRVGQSLFVSKDYGVVAKKLPSAAGDKKDETFTTIGAWYQESEDQKASSEQERLWYVALTRARDKLFLCGTSKEDKEGVLSIEQKEAFFKRAMDSLKIDPADITLSAQEKVPARRSRVEAAAAPEVLELPVVSPAKLARLSASAYAMIAWCPNAYRIAYRQGRNLQWTVNSGEESGGADFGSLAHWILARWDFNEDSLPQWLPQETNDLFANVERQLPPSLRSEFRDRETRRDMLAMLCAFAHTEAVGCLRALAAQENGKIFSRETPFRVQAGDLLLVGSIDLYYEDADGVHVRDWKTTGEDYAPSEYYDAQLDFYAYAVWRYREQKKYPALPLDKAILYTRQGENEISPRRFTTDEIEEIGGQIHSAAELALSGEFSKQYDKCRRCPWRLDCEKMN